MTYSGHFLRSIRDVHLDKKTCGLASILKGEKEIGNESIICIINMLHPFYFSHCFFFSFSSPKPGKKRDKLRK
jgi:hypothetical protein